MHRCICLEVLLATLFLMTTAIGADDMPPPGVLKERIERSGERWLYGRWNGISYDVVQSPKRTDVTASLLLSLLYTQDEVPGTTLEPDPWRKKIEPDRHHTVLVIGNEYSKVARRHNTADLLETLTNPQGYQETRYIESFETSVWVFPTPQRAVEWAYSAFDKRGQRNVALLSASSLGEVHWVRPLAPNWYEVNFVAGRVAASVFWHTRQGEANHPKAQAITWGLLYRILQHPNLLAGRMSPAQPDGTANLNGIIVAPLSQLQKRGVELQVTHTAKEWKTRVRVGQRWVELRAFDWEMRTWEGKTVKLSRPAFPYKRDLVAPIEEVRKALGM